MKFFSKNPRTKACRMLFPLVVFTLLLANFSCIKEREIPTRPNNDGEALVTLSLALPANAVPTRAMDAAADENVKEIDVLVFKDGKYAFTAQHEGAIVSEGSQGTNKKKFTVKLRQGDGYELVILANAREILANAGSSVINVNMRKTEVMNALSLSLAGKWNAATSGYTSFPMSSDPALTLPSDKKITEGMEISGISLYRMVAKIDVKLTTEAAKANFNLTSVHVYNRNTEGYLQPLFDGSNYVLNAKSSPTKPLAPNQDILEYTEITTEGDEPDKRGVSCVGEIFLFEADNTSAGLSLLTRPCLVVGGKYTVGGVEDATPTYYRVDFSTAATTYVDIKRNHLYNVNIIAVNGRGYGTPDEAFDSTPSNLEAHIVPWDQNNILDVISDGQYGLGVNRKTFEFFKDKVEGTTGEDNKLVVSTTFNHEWSVSVMDGNQVATSTSASKWLKVQKESGTAAYSLSSTVVNAPQNFYLQVDKNEGTEPRTATIHVTAGKLTQVITVTQSISPAISLTLKSGGNEVHELLWTNTNTTPKNLTVTWNPKDRSCSISNAVVNGGGFEYASGTPFGTTTGPGGEVNYPISPKEFTEQEKKDNPFIDRASTVSFTVYNGVDYITKSVLLRQVNYALTVNDSQSSAAEDVLTDKEYTLTIKCNTDWTVTKDNLNGLTAENVEIISGSGNQPANTAGFTFKYKIAKEKYGSVTFTFTPKTGTPVFITITSKEKLLPVFALSNIVCIEADGVKKLTFAEDEAALTSKGIPANAQGLLFKWGSLIGISGNGEKKSKFKVEDHVKFKPLEYSGSISDTWQTVPYCDVAGSDEDKAKDAFYDEQHGIYKDKGGYIAEQGKGDICRYISAQGNWVDGYWRMPTSAELREFYQTGTYEACSEGCYGWKHGGTTWEYAGSSMNKFGTAQIDAGWSIGPGITATEPTGSSRDRVLFPAAGYRDDSYGDLYSVGEWGAIWTSTIPAKSGTGSGRIATITPEYFQPNAQVYRMRALSVRCVRESNRE